MEPVGEIEGEGGVEVAAPKYLRFVSALLLGAALVAVPAALAGCGTDGGRPDATVDARPVTVDGPLAPPDLPRSVA